MKNYVTLFPCDKISTVVFEFQSCRDPRGLRVLTPSTHMRLLGMSSTNRPLTPVTERNMKIRPSTKAAASAAW